MRKYLSLLLSFALVIALFGCSKEERVSEETTIVKFNIKATNDTPTKAVKSAWEEGDEIHIFLEGITGKKYLTISLNSAGEWETELGGDMTNAEIAALTDGTMHGIYFPFDNVAIASDGADGVTFRSSGHSNPALNNLPIYTYYMTGSAPFTVSSEGGVTTITGTISMTIPEGYVQFFIAKSGSKYASDDQYRLSVQGICPTACASYSNGTFGTYRLTSNEPMWGYMYNNEGVVFSGKLFDRETDYPLWMWNNPANDHQFYLFDDNGTVANPAKTITFSGKTLSSLSAVKLSNVGMWERALPEPGSITMGSTKWADRNLGATSVDGRGWYFAWGDIPYSTESLKRYDMNYSSRYYYGTKTNPKYLYAQTPKGLIGIEPISLVGNYAIYDAARAYLGSEWRMPTKDEFVDLGTYPNEWKEAGELYPIEGAYFDEKLFFPAAGNYDGGVLRDYAEYAANPGDEYKGCFYLSSTFKQLTGDADPYKNCYYMYYGKNYTANSVGKIFDNGSNIVRGRSIRPVKAN